MLAKFLEPGEHTPPGNITPEPGQHNFPDVDISPNTAEVLKLIGLDLPLTVVPDTEMSPNTAELFKLIRFDATPTPSPRIPRRHV